MKKNNQTPPLPMEKELFKTPFSAKYWKLALKEFTNWRTLVIAALIIAMRVAIKSVSIPIVPGLYIGIDFIVNSVGSMIYGPIVALAAGAVSDTIGAILFPKGAYFFPFIFVEMMSGFVFALFLYRQKLTSWRVVLSRLAVVVICNFIINPAIMTVDYSLIMAKGYEFITIARVIKNSALFPLECIILVFWLGAVSFATYRMGLTYSMPEKLKLKPVHYVVLILSVGIAIGAIFGYMYYKKASDANKTSLAACCMIPETAITECITN